MAETPCPNVESCPMFPMFKLAPLLAIWKKNYCLGAYAQCARFQLSQKGEAVPRTLLPNGSHLAPAVAGDAQGTKDRLS
jgi:hypothetical protein